MATLDLNPVTVPTEYEIVDLSAVGSGVASEPQLIPTTSPSPEDLDFVTVETHGEGQPIEGAIGGGGDGLPSGDMGSMQSEPRHRSRGGRASQYLESKGFGWLLEVEEEDSEEDNKPLLLVTIILRACSLVTCQGAWFMSTHHQICFHIFALSYCLTARSWTLI